MVGRGSERITVVRRKVLTEEEEIVDRGSILETIEKQSRGPDFSRQLFRGYAREFFPNEMSEVIELMKEALRTVVIPVNSGGVCDIRKDAKLTSHTIRIGIRMSLTETG